MNILILFLTIIISSYFFLFEPDSDFVKIMLAIAPFAWGLMFLIRMLSQKKENKVGKINSEIKNLVIDPEEFEKKKQRSQLED